MEKGSCVTFVDEHTLKIRSVSFSGELKFKPHKRCQRNTAKWRRTHSNSTGSLPPARHKRPYIIQPLSQWSILFWMDSMGRFLPTDRHLQAKLSLCKVQILTMRYFFNPKHCNLPFKKFLPKISGQNSL